MACSGPAACTKEAEAVRLGRACGRVLLLVAMPKRSLQPRRAAQHHVLPAATHACWPLHVHLFAAPWTTRRCMGRSCCSACKSWRRPRPTSSSRRAPESGVPAHPTHPCHGGCCSHRECAAGLPWSIQAYQTPQPLQTARKPAGCHFSAPEPLPLPPPPAGRVGTVAQLHARACPLLS